ncbi:MAG: hypothetical protein C4309_04660 [Chloroflexota bacterium]
MHPGGVALSDVWKALPLEDNYTTLSAPVLDTVLRMVSPSGDPADASALNGLIGPRERVQGPAPSLRSGQALSRSPKPRTERQRSGSEGEAKGFRDARLVEPAVQYRTLPLPGLLPAPSLQEENHPAEGSLFNVVIQGDAPEVLRRYPDESVDLVFADPPYNLDKAYTTYDDEKDRETYLNWCNAWLDEYIRILKPTGSLYILNLPRWGMYHAAYLNRRLYFQNWIVWDALSEPRGKILPAHYALLFYTKHPTDFTFNYESVGLIDARFYCLRPSCIRQRKARGDDEKERLTDIWWDIHRIKHHRHRDVHPCQLPDALMERIIRLSTNPGDVVLDALAGTGTTAVTAAKLGRRYVAIDIDPAYVAITREKLAQVEVFGEVYRPPAPRPRPRYNKKALQLELQEIALKLGRLPTQEDVRQMSRYGLKPFLEAFPTWGKALKAAELLGVDSSRPRP